MKIVLNYLSIISVLVLTCILAVFIAYPNFKTLTNPHQFQLAKEPDGLKQYGHLLAKGGTPKTLFIQPQPTMIQSISNICSPYSNIFGVLMPIISFFSAIFLWIKQRRLGSS